MTTALTGQSPSLPISAAAAAGQQQAAAAPNPLSGLFGRVKALDTNELAAVAMVLAEEQMATHGAMGVAAQESQAAAGAQAAQAAQAQVQPVPVAASEPVAPAVAGAADAVGGASSEAVPVPSSQIAPRRAHDYWSAHIAQFAGRYLPDGPSMRPNCGPASVTMALRMIGLDIPGFNGQNSEAVLDQARIIGTGTNDVTVGTTDTELERVIEASGGRWSESNNFDEMLGWVQQGIPVVLSGNPAKGWNHRYSSDQVYPFDGGHWVTVSGYDPKTGYFIVNDPLSQVGPIYVSRQELQSYNQAHGGLGIAVFR